MRRINYTHWIIVLTELNSQSLVEITRYVTSIKVYLTLTNFQVHVYDEKTRKEIAVMKGGYAVALSLIVFFFPDITFRCKEREREPPDTRTVSSH